MEIFFSGSLPGEHRSFKYYGCAELAVAALHIHNTNYATLGISDDGEQNWGLPEHRLSVDEDRIRVDPAAGA